MRKIGYAAAVAYLCMAMLAGCSSGENRYTYREAGIGALNSGDYETAIASFDQAIEASKGLVGAFDIDVLRYRAEAEYLIRDYQAAADTYGILLEVDKELPEYYNLRCAARAGAGDYPGAVSDFNRSGELDPEGKAPGRAQALLAAGAALEGQGSSEEAMVLYEQAEAAGIESAELYNRMGLNRMTEEDYDGAVAYFSKGLSAADSGNVPELLYNQAAAYEQKGDFSKALELLTQYVEGGGQDEKALREIEFLKTR